MRAALTGLLLCALSCSRPAATAAPPGTVVIALESAPAALDPRFTTDANSALVADLVSDGLTAGDERGEPVPALAEWQHPSPLEWQFTLRANVRFHDGTPLTAADVAATYRSVLDPTMGSPKREAFAAIAAIEAPDPLTVVFRLREVSASFLESTSLGIMPAHLAADGPIAPAAVVGSGPFRVAEILDGGGVELAAWRDAPDGAPRLARVRFRVVPDGVVRALELANGSVHLVQNALDPDLLPWLAARPELELIISPGTTFQYLGLNLRDPRLADRRVRTALAAGIDRNAIVRHVLRDTATAATGLLPPAHWAYTGDVAQHPYDPARAAALLERAGLGRAASAAHRRFSYKTSTVELRRRIAEVFQHDLAGLGLGLDIRSYEWATFYDDIKRGNFELYALAWVGVRDPDIYFRMFHSTMQPPAGVNRGGYASPAMDRLVAAARATEDRAERRRLYAEVQRLAAEDLPIIPLWWAENVVVKSRTLRGFVPAPNGSLRSLATATFAAPAPSTAVSSARGPAPATTAWPPHSYFR
ncbi:MAG: ABC transporter substrate-binding protein [Myxococcales bacterium]|jgi:peptide/nickel transport system substrate-binding protein|nr:ABC transporter substrate-binding protein [Myxococcales bacterium]